MRHLSNQGIATIANGLLFAKLVTTDTDAVEEPAMEPAMEQAIEPVVEPAPAGHVVKIGELPVGKSWSAVNSEAYSKIVQALALADHDAKQDQEAYK